MVIHEGQTVLLKWVTAEKAAEILGITRQAIYARVKKLQWKAGEHFIKKGGRLWINVQAVYAWIEHPKAA